MVVGRRRAVTSFNEINTQIETAISHISDARRRNRYMAMWQARLWQYEASRRTDEKRLRDLEQNAKSIVKMIAAYSRNSAANLARLYPAKRARSHWYAARARYGARVECGGHIDLWEQVDIDRDPDMRVRDILPEVVLSNLIAHGRDKNRLCIIYCRSLDQYHSLPYNNNTGRLLARWLSSKYGDGARIEVTKTYWSDSQVDAARAEAIDKRHRQSPKRATDVVDPEYRFRYSGISQSEDKLRDNDRFAIL